MNGKLGEGQINGGGGLIKKGKMNKMNECEL